jgi:hypothetical protein
MRRTWLAPLVCVPPAIALLAHSGWTHPFEINALIGYAATWATYSRRVFTVGAWLFWGYLLFSQAMWVWPHVMAWGAVALFAALVIAVVWARFAPFVIARHRTPANTASTADVAS